MVLAVVGACGSGDAAVIDAGVLGDGGPLVDGGQAEFEDVCAAWEGTFPADAFEVTPADRNSLQALLDTHGVLRLAPGDYRVDGPTQVTIGSDQAIISLSPTAFPDVRVAAGSERVRLEGLAQLEVTFEPGAAIRYGCFKNLRATTIRVDGATVERNLFVALAQASLKVDTSASGAFSDNRFIKLNSHGAALPIEIQGDAARSSGGNAFLLVDAQTPPGSGFSIEDQRDVAFAGVDLEAYNWSNNEPTAFAFRVRNTGTFRAVHASGMTRQGDATTPAFDLDAEQVFLHRFGAPTANPILRLGPSNQLLASWRDRLSPARVQDDAPGGLRLFAQEDIGGDVTVALGDTTLTSEPDAATSAAVHDFLRGQGEGAAWSIPHFGAIPDPTGPDWAVGLAAHADESAAIQALVDSEGIAYLEPRTYYVGQPIVLGAGQGLVGAGAGKTALVALTPDVDMIDIRWGDPAACGAITAGFTLAELTMQGGRNGILSAAPGSQINQAVIAHVTFRNMANAGILIDGTYGWDNNVLAYVNFVDSTYGIHQHGQPRPADSCYAIGEWSTMGYLDKTVFYRNQFVGCDRAMLLEPTRPNNLDGIVESSFVGSTTSAITLGSGTSAFVIASSRFVDNAGAPVVQGPTAIINSTFEAGRGAAMVGHHVDLEGCTFTPGTSSTATVYGYVAPGDVRDPAFFDLSNSNVGIPLGPVTTSIPVAGILYNNELVASDALPAFLTSIQYYTEGTPNSQDDSREVLPLLGGASLPGSQLLRGGAWTP